MTVHGAVTSLEKGGPTEVGRLFSRDRNLCQAKTFLLSLSLFLTLAPPTMVVERGHEAGLRASVCSMETANQWGLEDSPLSLSLSQLHY